MFCCKLFLFLISLTVFNCVRCEVYRLPKNVKPVRYILTIKPNLNVDKLRYTTYKGSVVIELQALENTNYITLNSRDINIYKSKVRLSSINGREINVTATSTDYLAQTFTFHLEDELVKSERYNLTIGRFSRNLENQRGFFSGQYRIANSNSRFFAATAFEPTHARRAFPCFDEPALKAKFVISLIRPQEYLALSNEKLEITEDLGNGLFKDTFKETPKMSTYIVAFAVSDFKMKQKERHRIFGTPEIVEKGELDCALNTAVKTLHILEEFTGINFTLSKLDQFVIPDDYYIFKAIENWGLVIYQESALKNTNSSNVEELQRITACVAHEFGHQWFGNLVTAEWWDNLWLTESFAEYFSYYVISIVQPTWRIKDQFLISRVHEALVNEEFWGANSLTFPLRYMGQIPDPHIIYRKGAAIINMLSHFLGESAFKEGVQIYLQNRKFSTATPSDLYNALQKSADKKNIHNLLGNMTVAEILSTWVSKSGFPTVTVTRDYNSGSITVAQRSKFNKSDVWKIPINYLFSSHNQLRFSKTTADFWLTEKSATVNDKFPTFGWLLVNKQQTGYYRVNYDTENWNRIIQYLKSEHFKSIHVRNRAQLISDAFYFSHHKEIPIDIPLNLCEYLVQENDVIPLAAFYQGISRYLRIYNYEKDDDEYKYFFNHPLKKVTSAQYGNITTEYKIFEEYMKHVLSGMRDYLKAEPNPAESFLEKLYRLQHFTPLLRFL